MRSSSAIIIREHNIESHRTYPTTLPKQKRRIIRAQTTTNRHWSNTRRNSTRRRVNHITIPWLHNRRRIRRTRSSPRLIRICRLARHRASVDVVPREGELTAAEKQEVARRGEVVGEVKDEVADLALGGVGVDDEVEDGAEVARSDFRPLAVGVGGFRVLGANGDQD